MLSYDYKGKYLIFKILYCIIINFRYFRHNVKLYNY